MTQHIERARLLISQSRHEQAIRELRLELAEDPFHGLIGLVILLVGIRITWQLAAGTETQVFGPFETAAPAT